MQINTDIGRMNRRITFCKRECTCDEIGNQEDEFSDFYSCWASVGSVSGREYWAGREQHEENILSFRVRFCRKLAEIDKINYFIRYNDRLFDITDINNLQESLSVLVIRATERT